MSLSRVFLFGNHLEINFSNPCWCAGLPHNNKPYPHQITPSGIVLVVTLVSWSIRINNNLAKGIKHHVYCNLFLFSFFFLFLFLIQTSIYASIANPPGSALLPKRLILPSFAGLVMVGPDSKSSIDLKHYFGVKPTEFNFWATR